MIYTTLGPYREDMQDAGPLGFKVPGLRIFGAGSKWAEIDDRLEVRAEDYLIWKKWQSAFYGTDLASILVHRRIDTLVVAGCVTSGCVRATVVDACTHGYRVIIPRECVGDRTPDIHEANLFDMNAKNADVVSGRGGRGLLSPCRGRSRAAAIARAARLERGLRARLRGLRRHAPLSVSRPAPLEDAGPHGRCPLFVAVPRPDRHRLRRGDLPLRLQQLPHLERGADPVHVHLGRVPGRRDRRARAYPHRGRRLRGAGSDRAATPH